MRKKYQDTQCEAIHSMASGLYKVGAIDAEEMRYYDEMCLVKPPVPEAERAPSQKQAGGMRSGAPAYARGK